MTFKCDKACVGCANTYGSIMSKAQPLYSVKQLESYKNLVISGGEPMLFPDRTMKLAKILKKSVPGAKIFLYTAMNKDSNLMEKILPYIDGVNFTIHSQADDKDIMEFQSFQAMAGKHPNKAFRLYVDKATAKEVHILPSVWDRVNIKPWMGEKEMEAAGGCPEDLYYLGKPEAKHKVPPPGPRPPAQTFSKQKAPITENIHYCECCQMFRKRL